MNWSQVSDDLQNIGVFLLAFMGVVVVVLKTRFGAWLNKGIQIHWTEPRLQRRAEVINRVVVENNAEILQHIGDLRNENTRQHQESKDQIDRSFQRLHRRMDRADRERTVISQGLEKVNRRVDDISGHLMDHIANTGDRWRADHPEG